MMQKEFNEMFTDVLYHPLFEGARNAAAGTLSAQDIYQLTRDEKEIALYLIKLGRLVNEYEHNHKPAICGNS